ncbi:MAG: hypothetical protein PHS57_01880 [Alphaproteobacteria bacterium]|nr:hypothetical protein [Alphaproteobacteria bacterium]
MTRSYAVTVFWLMMAIASSVMLYHTSDRVHALDQKLRTLNEQIGQEQQSIHVLKAEWVYLTRPSRLAAKAEKYLDMQPTATKRIAALNGLDRLSPLPKGLAPKPNRSYAEASAKKLYDLATANKPPAASVLPRNRNERVFATLNAGRINDHVRLQHTATSVPSPNRLRALVGELGLAP